jgi:hypothetical protein
VESGEARTIASDKTRPLAHRLAAAHALGTSDEDADLTVLFQLASSDVEPELSTVAGQSAARVLLRQGRPDDAPLHDFSGSAYVAFDKAVARSQHEARRFRAPDR